MVYKDRELNVWRIKGQDAYVEGVPLSGSPDGIFGKERDAWERGWRRAFKVTTGQACKIEHDLNKRALADIPPALRQNYPEKMEGKSDGSA